MAIKKAVTEGKRIPAPQITDDEAYLRLGIPEGVSMRTGAKQRTTCDPLNFDGQDMHNVDKMEKVMSEFKEGSLHSGSKKGPHVKKHSQAVAIGLSEQRKADQGGY